ncbi:MAG: cytochrome c maturation protein CcmE [Alphaproteobacteria bacterium]|nr:cytochrome c maturation protein CcmE [Alphaproteobacteria bacterium]
MKGLKKKRRIQVIAVAAVALALATGLIGYAMRDGINFFRSPTQVAEAPPGPTEVFRIGGLVAEGTLTRGQGETITFSVTDGGATIPVSYTGVLPDLFGEGEGMVGTGKYVDGVFQASEILARHDETYMPAEVIDALKEQGVYVDPNS